MFCVILFLLFTFVHPAYFACSDEELAAALPADVASSAKCLSLNQQHFESIANSDVKVYTWTRGDTSLIGFCPLKIKYTFTPIIGLSSVQRLTVTMTPKSGPQCTEDESVDWQFIAISDAAGNFSVFVGNRDDGNWNLCHPFHILNGPFIYTIWRSFPPLLGGEGYGYSYVFYRSTGDCQLDEIHKFLDTYGVFWEETGIECDHATPVGDIDDEGL